MLSIIADENIPFVVDSFSTIGTITTLPASLITPSVVRTHDILLTRSVLDVNSDLLDGSSISFVGTATIGTDHIDQDYLATNNIGFSSAPGCNAQSVVEYVMTALFRHCESNSITTAQCTLGIIGVGSIGSLLFSTASKLGFKVLLCDPPRHDSGEEGFIPLCDLLPQCSVVSVHVPLHTAGEYSTLSLVDDTFLSLMQDNALLINSCRGKTLSESALLKHSSRLSPYVLDVWPLEPTISSQLLSATKIATPHIAGYSYDGKVTGTIMLYKAVCEFLGISGEWDPRMVYGELPELVLDASGMSLGAILSAVYPIMADDTNLRSLPLDSLFASNFAALRKNYPKRYEFRHWSIAHVKNDDIYNSLAQLGFKLV